MTMQTKKSHMPKDSLLFEKVIPALLVALGVVMLGLMLFATAVLLGFVNF